MDKQTRFDQLLAWLKNNRLFAIVMLVAIGIVGASQFVSSLASLVATGEHLFSKSSPDSAQSTITPERATESEQAPRAPSIATQVLKFGASGTGPGYFQDPRWIELSRHGELVIGDFGDDVPGRVQLFDLNGKFISQWFAKGRDNQPRDISKMALDPQGGGTLYLGYGTADIYRYDLAGNDLGKLGDLLPKSPSEPEVLASDPRGGVVSLWEYVGVDLVRYDHGAASPRLIRPDVFKGHLKDASFPMAVAADGVGNIYAVSHKSPVFKFSPDGEFLDRLGESGEGPEQLDDPVSAIAIDGAGHLVVSAFNGIHVLNPNGHYVGKFKRNCGPVRALTFDLNGFLYVLCSDAVVKYRLNLH